VLITTSYGPRRPSWWLAGSLAGAGVGLMAWGAIDFAQGSKCTQDPRACGAGQTQRDRGALLMSTAAPLLVVPLTKLWMPEMTRQRATPHASAAVTPRGIHVFGSW
jgi:hypothetical protein